MGLGRIEELVWGYSWEMCSLRVQMHAMEGIRAHVDLADALKYYLGNPNRHLADRPRKQIWAFSAADAPLGPTRAGVWLFRSLARGYNSAAPGEGFSRSDLGTSRQPAGFMLGPAPIGL